LPGTHIDKGFFAAARNVWIVSGIQKGEISHSVAGGPAEDKTEREEYEEHQKDDQPRITENPGAEHLFGGGSNWGCCHASIFAGNRGVSLAVLGLI
jgi:hypothetical protein